MVSVDVRKDLRVLLMGIAVLKKDEKRKKKMKSKKMIFGFLR